MPLIKLHGRNRDLVKVWDLRHNEVTMTLQGHQDMITGMQLSPDGSYLLTNGMDSKLCIWDMRPYAPQNRCVIVKILEGHQHNFEKNLLKCSWSQDGSKVTAGSSDPMVYIWDTTSRRILYKLPGHTGSVNEVVFTQQSPFWDLVAVISRYILGRSKLHHQYMFSLVLSVYAIFMPYETST